MKRYHIVHRTSYRYRTPVALGLHRLVLRPREGHRTTVIKHDLLISPRADLFWMDDLFGNHIALAEMTAVTDYLTITSDVIIQRLPVATDEAPAQPSRKSVMTLPVEYPQMEISLTRGYLDSVYPDELTSVSDWVNRIAGKFGATGNPTAVSVIERLNAAIYEQIRYRRRDERGVQSPEQTLSLNTGSCRDMATLLLEACRSLGIAARFVSGYLNSSASRAGVGSTHAWMEAYLPDCGWCGFDPTIGESVSHKHIALGVSAHPRGVMPVSGIYTGTWSDSLGVEVAISIQEVEEEPPCGPQGSH